MSPLITFSCYLVQTLHSQGPGDVSRTLWSAGRVKHRAVKQGPPVLGCQGTLAGGKIKDKLVKV